MIIRKIFKAETAHIVRGAQSCRCHQGPHGHSYKYELFLKSNTLDNAGMVTDFTFIKRYFNPLFDSFDHSMVLWFADEPEIKKFFKDNFERVIIADWNSTAELQSKFFYYISSKIIEYLNEKNLWTNGEQGVTVDSVIVHETETGYAKADKSDIIIDTKLWKPGNTDFSEGIKKDWTSEFKEFWEWLIR